MLASAPGRAGLHRHGRAAGAGKPYAARNADLRPAVLAGLRPDDRAPWRTGLRCGSKRQLESGRQAEPGGHAAHLLGDGRLDLAGAVVERSGDEILEHLAVVAEERRIDGDALHLVFAGHLDLDHARTGLALDRERGGALLQ